MVRVQYNTGEVYKKTENVRIPNTFSKFRSWIPRDASMDQGRVHSFHIYHPHGAPRLGSRWHESVRSSGLYVFTWALRAIGPSLVVRLARRSTWLGLPDSWPFTFQTGGALFRSEWHLKWFPLAAGGELWKHQMSISPRAGFFFFEPCLLVSVVHSFALSPWRRPVCFSCPRLDIPCLFYLIEMDGLKGQWLFQITF